MKFALFALTTLFLISCRKPAQDTFVGQILDGEGASVLTTDQKQTIDVRQSVANLRAGSDGKLLIEILDANDIDAGKSPQKRFTIRTSVPFQSLIDQMMKLYKDSKTKVVSPMTWTVTAAQSNLDHDLYFTITYDQGITADSSSFPADVAARFKIQADVGDAFIPQVRMIFVYDLVGE